MLIGLCNIPATFQKFITNISHHYLATFILLYMNGPLIFSK